MVRFLILLMLIWNIEIMEWYTHTHTHIHMVLFRFTGWLNSVVYLVCKLPLLWEVNDWCYIITSLTNSFTWCWYHDCSVSGSSPLPAYLRLDNSHVRDLLYSPSGGLMLGRTQVSTWLLCLLHDRHLATWTRCLRHEVQLSNEQKGEGCVRVCWGSHTLIWPIGG